MLLDREIYLAAQAMIRRHGTDAANQAAVRADELMKEGDLDGQRVWLQIVRAIEELQRNTPKASRFTKSTHYLYAATRCGRFTHF
jgi:hypothetical protein